MTPLARELTASGIQHNDALLTTIETFEENSISRNYLTLDIFE